MTTDFIFNVDLSTTYVIIRRDFYTPQDVTGHLSAPIGGAFFYDASSANAAARAHCIKESKECKEAPNSLGLMREPAVHFETDGLYVGGSVTRAEGRDRFEVRVSRLKAKGGSSGRNGEVVEGEAGRGVSRGGGSGGAAAAAGLPIVEEGEEGEGGEGDGETPLLRGTSGSKIGRLFTRKKTK